MLKDSEIPRYSTRRTHRTYAPEFKADLVAMCQQPGISIAAVASQHGMNANVLHRWLKEHQHGARHQLVTRNTSGPATAVHQQAAFVSLPLSTPRPLPTDERIKVELCRGALTMMVSWPVSAMQDFASWTTAILK